MKGKIKFLDAKSQKWGFILPDDNTGDIHFILNDFEGEIDKTNAAEQRVEFELEENSSGRHARRIHIIGVMGPLKKTVNVNQTNISLKSWAYVPFLEFRAQNGMHYSSVLELLAQIALPERWFFGTHPDPRNPFPILYNYITYTFFKIHKQGRVVESMSRNVRWAAFNTGLVDNLYDPIYMLFEENDRSDQPWKFYDFCVPGKGPSGKKLTSIFDPLPEPASYFNDNFDMLLDTSKDIHVDYDHVIIDGVRRGRFPHEFLSRHIPKGFSWQDISKMHMNQKQLFYTELSAAIDSDVQCMRAIRNRVEDAKSLAEKRTRWNFKTAIPQYYPRLDAMSLLLPLALVNDEEVDIALVVTRNPSGSYQGRTVLPLDWSYQNARLVCRPDSDWLVPDHIIEGNEEPADQAGSGDQSQPEPQTQTEVELSEVQIALTKLCPQCGIPMQIQTAPSGKHKGENFFVCPNYDHCKQVVPVG